MSITMGGLSVARVKPATASAATPLRVGLLEFLQTVLYDTVSTCTRKQRTWQDEVIRPRLIGGEGTRTSWAGGLPDCFELMSQSAALPDFC